MFRFFFFVGVGCFCHFVFGCFCFALSLSLSHTHTPHTHTHTHTPLHNTDKQLTWHTIIYPHTHARTTHTNTHARARAHTHTHTHTHTRTFRKSHPQTYTKQLEVVLCQLCLGLFVGVSHLVSRYGHLKGNPSGHLANLWLQRRSENPVVGKEDKENVPQERGEFTEGFKRARCIYCLAMFQC